MVDTVEAKFVADLSQFSGNVAAAQTSVQNFAAATQTQASRASASLVTMATNARAASASMVSGMSEAGREAARLSGAVEATGAAAEEGFRRVALRGRDIRGVMSGLASGTEETVGAVEHSMINLAARFVAANTALLPLAAGLAAVGGTLAYFVVRAVEANSALLNVQTSMRLGGVTDLAKADIESLIASLEKMPGSSFKVAGDVVAAFSNMSGSSKPLIESLSAATIAYATATNSDIPKMAETLSRAFADPAPGARQLRELIHAITPEQIAYVESVDRTGTRTQAQAALLQVFMTAISGQIRALRDAKQAELELFAATEGGESANWIFISQLERQIKALDDRTAAIDRGRRALEAQPAAARANVTTSVDVNFNPQQQQLERITAQIDRLREAQRALGEEFANTEQGTARYRELYSQLSNVGEQLRTARVQQRELDEQIGNVSSLETRRAMSESLATLEKRDRMEVLQEHIEAADLALRADNRSAQDIVNITTARNRDLAELEKVRTDIEVAQANLRKTNAEGNSRAILAADTARINAQRANAVRNSAEDINLQNEQAQAQQRFETAQTALTQQEADSRHRIALNEVTEREALVKEQGNSGRIGRAAELAELLELNARRTEIERTYYTTLRDLHTDDEKEFRGYQLRLEEIESESAARRAQIERQVGTQVVQEWDRHFQQVGSSVTTQVMGMVRGTTTLRQAFANVALDIVQQFIAAGAKMIATDAAVVAARLLGIETVKGAETAGAAGSILATIGQAMSKIAAGVGATIAGVTANQAPLVGPAAVPEGIAAGAAVEAAAVGAVGAAAAFEIGAWEIPRMGAAILHPNEMVLPGPSADVVRDAITGGGGGGGDTHMHFPGVMDARGFLQAISNHSSPIAKIISKAMTRNPGSRPRF